MEFELNPRFDTRKSFYGKAKIRNENGKTILKSYNTDVAYIEKGIPKISGFYSSTTSRHIKEFLKQAGLKAKNKKQIQKDYMGILK